MAGTLVQLALSNLLVSAALAGVAYAVHRRGRYPNIAHLLWVLVLAKLVTPPLLAVTVARLPTLGAPTSPSGEGAGTVSQVPASILDSIVVVLLAAWMLGSAIVLIASLARIWRFDRLLRRTSAPADDRLQWLAGDVAYELGLDRAPRLDLTTARISPMTWWVGGRIRIVLPASLLAELEYDQLRWVLAHELAHVQRRDHLVRWLEWLACVAFWWNPVAWFARATLRLDEEAACDALVVERLGADGRHYARALLAVVELLSRRGLQPPAVATGIDGGGSLERRFRLLLSRRGPRRVPRGLVVALLAGSLVVMPFGVGVTTDRPPGDEPLDPWLADQIQLSPAETAFLQPVVRGRTTAGDDVETAQLSGNLKSAKAGARTSTSRKGKANRTAGAKRTKKGTRKTARAKARAARKAQGPAAAPLSVLASGGGPVLRF